MSDLKIELSRYIEIFAESSKVFSISKKVNFIFGKNGTGKSTIAGVIRDQFSSSYNIQVFKDFEALVGDNKRLDAVALGKENVTIQKKIDIIDAELVNIDKGITEPVDKTENFFSKAKTANENLKKQQNKIDEFFKKSATLIKNITNPQIAKTSYDKNDFKNEIGNSKLLSEGDIEKHKKTIKSEMKNEVEDIIFPNYDFIKWINTINEILQSYVSQQQIIEELENSQEKQNFAKIGMDIHKRDEKCSFCGNIITKERWELLGNFFNDEVKKLETRIKETVDKIEQELVTIDAIIDIDKNKFYKNYENKIETLNLEIKNIKNEYKDIFRNMQSALKIKSQNLFNETNKLKLEVPNGFDTIRISIDKIIKENNDFSQNLTPEQDKAKAALRYHEIKMALDTFSYEAENANLINLDKQKNDAEKTLNEKIMERAQKLIEKQNLVSQTKDEAIISDKINKLLKNMGVASFSLDLINSTDEKQKGQYKIRSHDGTIRSIDELSKGEKNIIAFLFFLFSLDEVNTDRKPRIVIFDDPMTSNDDTMQYLMIGELIKFYRAINDDNYFILLTHNCHFYLNVRPSISGKYKQNGNEVSFYEKYGNYYLYSDGKHSTIKTITNSKEDFNTNYEMLWKELLFLYNSKEATPDLMLNPCRKICETYMKFTKRGLEKFYGDNINAKKLFDVNQHSVDDLEAEQNGKTKEEIKSILEELFKSNDAEEHFNSYFK